MVDPRQRELAENIFERSQRREKEINNALKQEYARREAAVKVPSRAGGNYDESNDSTAQQHLLG